MSIREEPPVLNEKKCNEALEQLASVATHSSISGAEEETSVNGMICRLERNHLSNLMRITNFTQL